jgi:predicted small metal-binding protein
MVTKQYKQLGCLDLDPKTYCAFQVRAETEAEVLKLFAMHAKECHWLESLPRILAAAVKAAIKTVTV